jgi:hypothetical protein
MHAGATMALATLEYSEDCVMLRYRWREAGAPWRSVTQRIKLARDSRHFGGAQCYFVCPGCARRAWKLYDAGAGRFACRHCGKLTHQSQREGSWLRALRRAIKIRKHLGGSGNLSNPFPPRPAKMTLRIYECLLQEARRLEAMPPEAWLQAGTKNIRLGIRRSAAGASRRQWWPGRSKRRA